MTTDTLRDLQQSMGATFAPDGIPLMFSSPGREFFAAQNDVLLMDRSHEGRLELTGRDRLALLHRLSTNDIESMREGERRATIFTNPNGRIIDRVTVYHRGDRVLLLTEPGRGAAVQQYLQRNIFFNDDLHITDLQPTTVAFALHGAKADAAVARLGVTDDMAELALRDGATAFVARDRALQGGHWRIIAPADDLHAKILWGRLIVGGTAQSVIEVSDTLRVIAPGGILPAGSLAYNLLRVRAGRPAALRELSDAYIPLEVGLWDEVSFTKGCYTGQEIIARMESRRRLAKTSVSVDLSASLDVPIGASAALLLDGREVGKLTSSASASGSQHFGIAVVKLAAAQVGTVLHAGDVTATITGFTGSQPADLVEDN